MNQTSLVFLIFLLLTAGVYLLLGGIVYYHLKTYSLKQDAGQKAKLLFSVGLLLTFGIITLQFFAVDWDQAQATMENVINLNFLRKNYD